MVEYLLEIGIDSMSLNPVTVLATTRHVLVVEKRMDRSPRGMRQAEKMGAT